MSRSICQGGAVQPRAGGSGTNVGLPDWVLVLDDYHVIGASDLHEAVAFLLEHLPDRLHLVMAALPIRRRPWHRNRQEDVTSQGPGDLGDPR